MALRAPRFARTVRQLALTVSLALALREEGLRPSRCALTPNASADEPCMVDRWVVLTHLRSYSDQHSSSDPEMTWSEPLVTK